MAKVKILINGKKIVADSSQTILEVVHQNNIDHIPNLCLEPQLEPFNSCYVCVVEVMGRKNLVPACSTKVEDRMVITTSNERVFQARRTSLELLLSNHYADCLAPCTLTCPAGVDVQGYLALIANGNIQEAVQLIKQTNPLPAVCGRVCTRPCEVACRRNLLDEKVGIDFLKRYASDFDMQFAWEHVTPEIDEEKDQRIAIVGAGPAGLSAAFYLRIQGYKVTIFEAMPEAGGMLRYGIPAYRLPFDVLDAEIDTILELGVELRTNMALGEDYTIKSLKSDGFDAIFLALGAWGTRKLGVPGQDAVNVLSGIKFLENVGREKPTKVYGKVVVVGGGNTAIDCARTSLRLGADEVILLYRRTEKEMPANEMEIHAAKEEGVEMQFLAAPIEVLTENEKVKSLKCIRMELGSPDSSGRRRPVPMEGSDFILNCDFVFAAVGQNPKLSFLTQKPEEMLPANGQLQLTRWGSMMVKDDTFETDTEGVFGGGDMVTGAATAIEAIAAGRKAANGISSYLETGFAKAEPKFFNSRKDDFQEVSQKDLRYQEEIAPVKMPELDSKERISSFDEVELGLSDEDAIKESKRCLECGCEALFDCKLRKYASDYGILVDRYRGEVNQYDLDRSHPLIELDPNKCILCGRCVRVCTDIVGASVYGYEFRGFNSIVKPEMGKKLQETNCISCGMCIATCPTGAIAAKSIMPKPGPWDLEKTSSTCTYCGVGCSLNINHLDDSVVKITAADADTPTHGNLCRMGRFGLGFVLDDNRILDPSLAEADESDTADWEVILSHLTEQTRKLLKNCTGEDIAVFVSPRMTNEEIYLIQKFSRLVLKTNNITSVTLSNKAVNDSTVFSTATFDDIENASVIFISLADLQRDHGVVNFMVNAAQRKGAKIVTVGSTTNGNLNRPDIHLSISPGSESDFYRGLMKAGLEKQNETAFASEEYMNFHKQLEQVDTKKIEAATGLHWEEIENVADLLRNSERPVFVSDRHYEGMRNPMDLCLLRAAASFYAAPLAIFTAFNNSQGLLDLIGDQKCFPGYQPMDDQAIMKKFEQGWCAALKENPASNSRILNDLKDKRFKVVFSFGEDLLAHEPDLKKVLEEMDLVVYADTLYGETAKVADVVLPLCTFAETSGTYTNGLRKLGSVKKAIDPLSGFENWQIITILAEQFGIRYKFDYESVQDIQSEMKELIPIYSQVEFDYDCQYWDINAVSFSRFHKVFDENSLQSNVTSGEYKPSLNSNTVRAWFDRYWATLDL